MRCGAASSQGAGGFVLVAILVLTMLASMVALSMMFRLRAEETGIAVSTGQEQAWAAATSGIYEAMQAAASAPAGSLDWLNDSERFQKREVFNDGADTWYFTVYSPGDGLFTTDRRFGLTDEASRLNLNVASEEIVAKLPRMQGARADALLDARDADEEARLEGAESPYYQALAWPYAVRNGSFKSVEELLLLKGFSASEVFGEDVNLNFGLEPSEDDGDASFPPDNANGSLDMGLRRYFTVHSYERNVDREGLARLPLNNRALTLEETGLPEETLRFIYLMRSNNVPLIDPVDLLEARRTLVNEEGEEEEVSSGVGLEELPLVLDKLTATNATFRVGLVNINTAPAAVLQALPGLDLSAAESIVLARAGLTDDKRASVAWLLQDRIVELEAFRQLAPLITSRAGQFRFHVIGYGLPSGRYRVYEAIVDTVPDTPTISYVRDLTRLGLPFSISEEPAFGREVASGDF